MRLATNSSHVLVGETQLRAVLAVPIAVRRQILGFGHNGKVTVRAVYPIVSVPLDAHSVAVNYVVGHLVIPDLPPLEIGGFRKVELAQLQFGYHVVLYLVLGVHAKPDLVFQKRVRAVQCAVFGRACDNHGIALFDNLVSVERQLLRRHAHAACSEYSRAAERYVLVLGIELQAVVAHDRQLRARRFFKELGQLVARHRLLRARRLGHDELVLGRAVLGERHARFGYDGRSILLVHGRVALARAPAKNRYPHDYSHRRSD